MEGKILSANKYMAEKTIKREDLARLERQMNNLMKLVDISSVINSTLDIGKLLVIIMEIIKEIMETEASTLLLYDERDKNLAFKVALGEGGKELQEKYRVNLGQGIAGWVAQNRKSLYVNDCYSDPRFDPKYDQQTGFKTNAIMCAPLLFKGKLLGVIQAINPLHAPAFTEEDMHLYNIFSVQAALAVQNAVFFRNALEEERIKSEITSAKSIQESLNPVINRSFGAVTIAAKSISAREVGGEFYSLFEFGGNRIGFSLGDIHEKGVPGSLHASIVSGAIKALAGTRGENPAMVFRLLNSAIAEDLKSIRELSLFYSVIDTVEKVIRFASAGLMYPVLVRDGIARYLRFGRLSMEQEGSDPSLISVRLRRGDVFAVITGGILKVRNRGGKMLGLKKVMKFLEGSFPGPAEMIDSLIKHAKGYSENIERQDDISIMAIRVG